MLKALTAFLQLNTSHVAYIPLPYIQQKNHNLIKDGDMYDYERIWTED